MSGFVHEKRTGGNGMLVRVSAIAAIGGLLFGSDTRVISGALLHILRKVPETKGRSLEDIQADLLGDTAAGPSDRVGTADEATPVVRHESTGAGS